MAAVTYELIKKTVERKRAEAASTRLTDQLRRRCSCRWGQQAPSKR